MSEQSDPSSSSVSADSADRPLPVAPIEAEPLAVQPLNAAPFPEQAPIPGFAPIGYSGIYATGRPGIITAIGVISIVVASLSILAGGVLGLWNFGMLMFASSATGQSTVAVPAASQVVTAESELVSDRGLSAADRKIGMIGLSRVRPLTEARRRQLEELLAQNGKDVLNLTGPMLTSDRVEANVWSSGRMPTARGGDDGPDFYVLGQGRLEISDDHATFVPSNGEPSVRVSAPVVDEVEAGNDTRAATSTTQGSVVPLSAAQIQGVLRRVKQLGGKMNPSQTQALTQTLRNPGEQLIIATAGGGDPAAQVTAASTMGDGSVFLQTNRTASAGAGQGNTWSMITFDSTGQVTNSSTSTSGVTMANSTVSVGSGGPWSGLGMTLPVLALSGSVLNVLLAVLLMIAGIFSLRQSRLAAKMHWIYVWIKIPAALFAAGMTCWMWLSLLESVGSARVPWIVAISLVPALVGLIYPVALLLALRSRSVRAYFGGISSADLYR